MNYTETTSFLFNALPAYQNIGTEAYKDNLDNTIALLEVLDNPHQKIKTIHVAGTNGKGSVSHILATIFQKCGYKTGLYTSPHLLDFRERIRVEGEMISEQAVIDFTAKYKADFERIQPSFFEMTVGMAFQHFANEEVDIAIIETGLGGRLDSTNVISPEASVITNISIDHADILGDTLEKIAVEKAGIIKKDTPTILGDISNSLLPVFTQIAEEKNSVLHESNKIFKVVNQKGNKRFQNITYNKVGKYFALDTDLRGHYQSKNIATALLTIDVIREQGHFIIDNRIVMRSLQRISKTTGLRGRWDTIHIGPLWLADTAHNEVGIAAVMEHIQSLPHKRKIVIYGCVDDKDVDKILPLLDPDCRYILTNSSNKRSYNADTLFEKAELHNLSCEVQPTVDLAMERAKSLASRDDVVIVCGSTFLVADVMARQDTLD